MTDPGRLAIAVTHADGRVTRWGPDEVDGRNIPADLTFSTSIPGGDKDMTCSLLRRIDQSYPDQDLFDDVLIYGPGGRNAWQGRMQQFPRSHSDSFRITPGAVGWAAHLRDNPAFTEIYIDRDLGRWRGPSRSLEISGLGNNFSYSPHAVQADIAGGTPGISTEFTGDWAATSRPKSEAWYIMPAGSVVGRLRATWTRSSTVDATSSYFNWYGYLTNTDDSFSNAVSSGNLRAAGPGVLDLAGTGDQRCAVLQHFFDQGPNGAANLKYAIHWTDVRVIGNHGLPLPGSGLTEGLYASDMVADVVSRQAPLLTYSTGPGGSIEPSDFTIPQAAYHEPVTAEFVVSDVNKYQLYDWGVEGREFFYRRPDPDRLCWEARLGDGAGMDADGYTGEQVINGVFVTYSDPTGQQLTVGPPGGPFDATDSALADASVENPANSHNLGPKWDNLTLSFPTTQSGATQIGVVYLAERSLATRRGSLTLTGLVRHPQEGKVPVWRVRAGDWVRVTDLDGGNASVQRKILETSYSHASRSITLSLDNSVAKLTAILERVGVLSGIQRGGGF